MRFFFVANAARSDKRPSLILAQLNEFYAQRPRPWCSPNARGRFRRRQARQRSRREGRTHKYRRDEKGTP